jgi:hypothetical protein
MRRSPHSGFALPESKSFYIGLLRDGEKSAERIAELGTQLPTVTGARGGKEKHRRRREDGESEAEEALLEYVAQQKAAAVKALATFSYPNPSQTRIVGWMLKRWSYPWSVRKKNSNEVRDRPTRTTLITLLSKI